MPNRWVALGSCAESAGEPKHLYFEFVFDNVPEAGDWFSTLGQLLQFNQPRVQFLDSNVVTLCLSENVR